MYWAVVVPSYVSSGIGLFIASAFGFPAINRYKAWKSDPARERVCRRNWRGEYVPDLAIIRTERAFWLVLSALFLIGLIADFVIMTAQKP